MTEDELLALVERRHVTLKEKVGCNMPLGQMPPATRRLVERNVDEFHRFDRQIVNYLKTQPAPVPVGTMILHLTTDRVNFIELDRETGQPVYMSGGDGMNNGLRILLYSYPSNGSTHSKP